MEWIRTEQLCKTYGSGENAVHALNDVNITIERGEFVAICGASGSGKSTLLNLLGAIDRPSSGRVIIDGTDITRKTEEQLAAFRRRRIGFVFQFFNIIPVLTVEENIGVPLMLDGKRPDKRAIDAALKQIGLSDKRNKLPSQLSGGQQQRVGIARALAVNPQVILFDEPTSALDPELVGEVLSVIRDVAKKLKVTMIIVTHEIAFAREVADQIVFMEGGSVVETGTPEEVLVHPREERTKAFLNRYLGGNVLRDGAGI